MICPRCNRETKRVVRGHCVSCYSILLGKGEIQKIFKQPIPDLFTTEQSEFFTGLMLGDGGLVWGKAKSYPRLNMTRQVQDRDYLFWQYEIFKDFYGTPPKYFKSLHKKVKKYYEGYGCRTRSGQIFADYYQKWYPNGKKIVPRDLVLTPLILLVWFLDDGCITISSEHSLTIKLSTDGFIENDTEYLAQLLEAYVGEEINMYKNGNGWILKANTLVATKIIKIIEPIFPECMERKKTWRNFDWDYFNNNLNNFGDKKGNVPGNAKLNINIANEIRRLHVEEKFSHSELSTKFGVCKPNISQILSNKIWKVK